MGKLVCPCAQPMRIMGTLRLPTHPHRVIARDPLSTPSTPTFPSVSAAVCLQVFLERRSALVGG